VEDGPSWSCGQACAGGLGGHVEQPAAGGRGQWWGSADEGVGGLAVARGKGCRGRVRHGGEVDQQPAGRPRPRTQEGPDLREEIGAFWCAGSGDGKVIVGDDLSGLDGGDLGRGERVVPR
jgi:hypothetical protein